MAVILALASLALYLAGRQEPHVEPDDPAVKELSGAIHAYKLLNEYGYRVVPPAHATQGAIQGMVRQADEFSTYIPPDQAEEFARRAAGQRRGTGLRIDRQGEKLIVIGPVRGSPAHQAAIFAGMHILSIDGIDAADLSLARARELLRGSESEDVKLRLRDAEGNEVLRTLRPGVFKLETVVGIARDEDGRWAYELDEERHVSYLRISEFVRRTPDELRDAYRRLDDPQGLVLDLRGNPGGDRAAGLAIADCFLPGGQIGRTESRTGKRHAYYAHADGTFPPIPTVVLIDGATASAAEIVAGALQAHGRGLLLGQPSYGKWCVQSTIDLGHGLGQIHLTTARFFLTPTAATTGPHLPSASDANAGLAKIPPPLTPDVPVVLTSRAAERLEPLRARAVVLPPPRFPATTRPAPRRARQLRRAILKLDTQLARALELLHQQRVPTTRPAGAPVLKTMPAGTPSE